VNSEILFLQILMLDAGIVPDTSSPHDSPSDDFWDWDAVKPNSINVQLDTLSDEDQKKVKRRYRKLWKKACRRYGVDPKSLKGPGFSSKKRYLVKRMLLADFDS
jgi:hypothetical protein